MGNKMRRHRHILLLIILIAITSCSEQSRNKTELYNDSLKIKWIQAPEYLNDRTIDMLDKKSESIYQLSYQHNSNAIYDSIVLTNSLNENSGLFNKISIYRKTKLIFEYTDEYLEVIGLPYSLFVEQEIVFQREYLYIFKLFGGFHPENYLVIKTTPDTTYIFGKTKQNSGLIFGDIDFDGKIEIGGFTDWCEEYENHKCPDSTLFEVFEIGKGFPLDSALTSYFRKLLMK